MTIAAMITIHIVFMRDSPYHERSRRWRNKVFEPLTAPSSVGAPHESRYLIGHLLPVMDPVVDIASFGRGGRPRSSEQAIDLVGGLRQGGLAQEATVSIDDDGWEASRPIP